MLDLKYAVPGGIRGVQAGERLPGADYMDERWDTVIAVSDAYVVELPLKNAQGEVVVRLDRGDGVEVSLTVPAAGWNAVHLKPVVDQNFLEVTLVGAKPQADDPAQFRFSVTPNPVSSTAAVELFLPENGSLTIELFDALGRKVRTIVPEGAARSAQIYKFSFDAGTLSSGIYFLRLRYEIALEDARVVTKKIAVVK